MPPDAEIPSGFAGFVHHGGRRIGENKTPPGSLRAGQSGRWSKDQPAAWPASAASSSSATMLVILIIGFTAGPAVSL
jgi:hypothetical protein